MYTSKDIRPGRDGHCLGDLHDRITRETGLSEEAVRQMMTKECLLWIEKMRHFGEGMLCGKVVPLAIHRQD